MRDEKKEQRPEPRPNGRDENFTNRTTKLPLPKPNPEYDSDVLKGDNGDNRTR